MQNEVLLVILCPRLSQIDTDLFLALKNFVPLREICGYFFDLYGWHALKGQKLLAQGNVLGIKAVSKAPCKGKSFTKCRKF